MGRCIFRVSLCFLMTASLASGCASVGSKGDDGAVVTEPADSGGGPVIKVLDTGAEPRVVLRAAPTVGAAQIATIHMKMAFAMNGQTTVTIPPLKMEMVTKVTAVADNGDISYVFKVTAAEAVDDGTVDSKVAAATAETLGPLVGLGGDVAITSRLFAKSGSVGMTGEVPATLKPIIDGFERSLAQLSTPLPEQAVGVGARWQITQRLRSGGMTLKQISVVELTAIDGGVIQTKTTIAQSAGAQVLDNPDLPEGTVATLNSLGGSGSGAATWDMDQVFPSSSRGSVKTVTQMSIAAQGHTQEVEMTIGISMELAAP